MIHKNLRDMHVLSVYPKSKTAAKKDYLGSQRDIDDLYNVLQKANRDTPGGLFSMLEVRNNTTGVLIHSVTYAESKLRAEIGTRMCREDS